MPPKKPSGKRADTVAAEAVPASQTSSQGTSARKTRGGKKSTASAAAAAGDKQSDGLALSSSLVEGLCNGANVAAVVAQFINALQENAVAAVSGIVHTICIASGAKDVVIDDGSIADESGIATVLEEVFARLPVSEAAVYFLIHRDAKFKRFRKNFPAFFERLVVACYAAGILHDDAFLPMLTPWLAAMSESKSRGFRHTASLAMFAIIQGLNDRAVTLATSLQAASRREAPAIQAKYDAIMALQSQLFSVSLHQRVKDIAPEIRLLAVQSLKQYFLSAPDIYINNGFLRYLILAFHDKRAEIRIEALDFFVQALSTLNAHLPRMQDFIRHVAKRVVEMTSDVETKCADLALKAAALIIKYDFEQGNDASGTATFDHEMIDTILMSIMDDRAGIRATAGVLLKVVIRYRNAHADEAAQAALRGQTLAFLATTLREHYKEPLAEAYLVDSLWRDDDPPRLLTEYRVFLDLARGDSRSDAVTGLRLLTAVLLKTRGELQLGPTAKDDIRHTTIKSDKKATDATADLCARMSKDIASQIGSVLEKHGAADEMLVCLAKLLCAVDLGVLTTQQLAASFRSALTALRQGTSALKSGDAAALSCLSDAWRTVAFTEHPQKAEGDAQLHDLVKQILRQLASTEKSNRSRDDGELQDVWFRVELISTVVALTDQWGLFRAALTRYASTAAQSHGIVRHVVATCANTLLWLVGSHQADPSLDHAALQGHIASAATALLQLGSIESGDENTLVLRCETLTRLCDLACLPHVDLPQAEQEGIIDAVADVTDECNEVLRALYDRMKDTLQAAATAGSTAAATTSVTTYRRETSLWEGRVMRLSCGVVRLFTFDRIDSALAPKALLLWTRTPLKAASDLYKGLFHYVRDKAAAASPELERAMLTAAYTQCAMLGVNKTALEQLYQVGYKLASMHFLGTDKHYPAVVKIVRFGVEFAATTDPTILHAVAPYCSKLRQHDALNIAESLKSNDLFNSASQSNAFVATFVSAIRKAARLEDAGRLPTTTPARGVSTAKRGRGADSAVLSAIDEALTGTEIAESGATAARAKKRTALETVTPARVTDATGWRVRDASAAVAAVLATPVEPAVTASQKAAQTAKNGGATKLAKSAKAPPKPSPNTVTVSSMLGELDSEVFIATHEWND